MSVILAVNGITEIYQAKPVSPRHGRPEPAGDRESQKQHSSFDHSSLHAQTAYQEQNTNRPHPKPALLARDLMSAPVLTLPSDSTVVAVWEIMSHKDFHHIPITSVHGTLVGMVSYRDLLQAVPELITENDRRLATQKLVAEIMSPRVVSATPTTDIREVARVMLEERIHAVPIVDHDRRLVGMLSTRDLVRGIANHGPLELWT